MGYTARGSSKKSEQTPLSVFPSETCSTSLFCRPSYSLSPPLPLRPFPITSCPSPAYSICVAAFLLHRTCQFALGEGIGGKGVSKTPRMDETIVAWLYITHCESIVRLCRCFKGKPNCNFLARSRLLNDIDNLSHA